MTTIWHTALTSLFSIAVLFLVTKLMGVKQVSQMTMFDYITGITVGNITAELATELEEPVIPLTALLLYVAAALIISLLSSKSLKLRTLFAGKPLVLLRDGVIYRKHLKKSRIDLNEFLTYCRINGWFDLNQLHLAVLEHNGQVSFLPKDTDRPASPRDLHLHPQQSQLPLPIVMDGQLLVENLRQAGKQASWAHRALLRQGYRDEKDVLLALWSGGEGITVFPLKPPQSNATEENPV